MKSRFLKIASGFSAALVLFLATGTTNAAQSSANATARLVTAISIVKTGDLNFGDVLAGAAVGTVRMAPGGARSRTGGAQLGSGLLAQAASFQVGGQARERYAITLPASVNVVSGANTMVVDTFRSNPNGTGRLSAAGAQNLNIGATLHVGANQASGTYTGTFSVTVAYN